MTPEARAAGREALTPARAALDTLTSFRNEHPRIADYRVEETHTALTRTVTLLSRLDSGSDPELAAALIQFRDR